MEDITEPPDDPSQMTATNRHGTLSEKLPIMEKTKEELSADLEYDNIKKEEPLEEVFNSSIPLLEESNDMFEDVDDVDGPEYVDANYEGIAEVDGVDYFICEEFKIRQVPKPVIITRPLYQLFDCIISKHIILDPEYQRDVVWDEGRAALLVSSILMGYFIPPIIFNCVQRLVEIEDGTQRMQYKRICVDGKQRLTSVWKFMTGQIGFFDSNKPSKKWYFCEPTVDLGHSAANRNILPASVKEFFKNQAFCCYEYDELTQETEETMFQLVQKGIAMTPGEKMRAMSTEWATFTKDYEDNYPTVINLCKQQRGSGFRLVLTCFTMIREVTIPRKKPPGAPQGPILQASQSVLTKMLESKEPIDDDLKLRYKTVFDKFAKLVEMSSTQLTTTRWRINRDSAFDPTPTWLRAKEVDTGKTFSPAELLATVVLITIHMAKHTDEELLEDIQWMRYYLRLERVELRINAQCWRRIWQFVSVELNLRRADKASKPAFPVHQTARARARKSTANERAKLAKKKGKGKSKPKSKVNSTSQARASASKPKARPRPKQPTRATTEESIGESDLDLFPNLTRRERPNRLVQTESDESSELSELSDPEDPPSEDSSNEATGHPDFRELRTRSIRRIVDEDDNDDEDDEVVLISSTDPIRSRIHVDMPSVSRSPALSENIFRVGLGRFGSSSSISDSGLQSSSVTAATQSTPSSTKSKQSPFGPTVKISSGQASITCKQDGNEDGREDPPVNNAAGTSDSLSNLTPANSVILDGVNVLVHPMTREKTFQHSLLPSLGTKDTGNSSGVNVLDAKAKINGETSAVLIASAQAVSDSLRDDSRHGHPRSIENENNSDLGRLQGRPSTVKDGIVGLDDGQRIPTRKREGSPAVSKLDAKRAKA